MSPPKGDVEAMPEVIVGRIDFFFVVLGPALPFIGEGKLQSSRRERHAAILGVV